MSSTAATAATTGAGCAGGKYMTFRLSSEEYGLEILKVRDVIALMEMTRVPRTADFIRGVINLRGEVIPVADLKVRFGMGTTELTEQTVIIVTELPAEDRERTMGILTDEVLEVADLPAGEIAPAPDLGSGHAATDFIAGVGKTERGIIFLLDIVKALDVSPNAELVDVTHQGE